MPGAWCGDTACSGTGLGSPGGQETLDTLMQRCASFMANGQSDMLISNITPHGQIRKLWCFHKIRCVIVMSSLYIED